MVAKQNEQLVTRVLNTLPKNIKPVDYLMKRLSISRESAYRRMRGDIPFTFEEITTLSLELGFSVDEVVGTSKEKRIFFDMHSNSLSEPEENFRSMFREYSDYVGLIAKANETEVFSVINRVSLFLLEKHEYLFKLFYYRWIHQTYNFPVNKPFSEIIIPDEILDIQKKFQQRASRISNLNFIIDRNIFLATVREIQYYRNRQLISKEDTMHLKQDLYQLLEQMESLIQKGTNEKGRTCNFYLSLLDVEANSVCSTYDNNQASLYWVYSVNAVIIRNQEICAMHKKWLESMKKHSVLITQSNEILQTEFIFRQREYIENIDKNLSFYS
jgi:hypothetical protein